MARASITNRATVATTQNLCTQSQTMDDASYNFLNITATGNSAIAPDGTMTATTWTSNTASNTSHFIQKVVSTHTAGRIYCMSVYIKSGTANWLKFIPDGANSVGINFDVQNGVVGVISGPVLSTAITAAPNGFYRCSAVYKCTVTGDNNRFYLASGNDVVTFADATNSIIVWGFQVEQRSSVGPYQVTVGSVVNTGTPRNYTSGRTALPITQNLVTYSQQMDDSSYALNQVTASANSAIAPDGTMTATTYTDNAVNAQHYIRKAYSVTTNLRTFTASVYVKAGTLHWFGMYADDSNTIVVFFDVLNGVIGTSSGNVSGSIVSVGNGWYRCSSTFLKTIGSANRFYMATADNTISFTGGTGTLLFWGNQYVQANWAGTYQITTASTVNTGNIRNI